jgi:putative membrane protein
MKFATSIARSFVLIAWAILFAHLWRAHESLRYLGPRTQWVIPFGAVTLTLAAAANAFYAVLEPQRKRLSAREVLGSLPLLVPIVAIIAVPHATLGAHAVSKKQATRDVLFTQLGRHAARTPSSNGTSFAAIATATLQTKGWVGLKPGDRVQLSGIVARGTTDKGTFGLARFLISCCVADAIPVIVPIDPGGGVVPPDDAWIRVTGRMEQRGKRLVVRAQAMERTVAPKSPYLRA